MKIEEIHANLIALGTTFRNLEIIDKNVRYAAVNINGDVLFSEIEIKWIDGYFGYDDDYCLISFKVGFGVNNETAKQSQVKF